MTSQPPCPAWQDSPACMRQMDGLEFALPATPGSTALFSFMDDVFALTREFYDGGRPPGMGLSIRFTRGTRALIGMQQFERTASVEVLMLRGFTGHEQFRQRLYAIARNRGAIPHWGLIHEIDAAEVSRRYGARLTRWRAQLSRLITTGGGRTSTFRTAFSISRGLEPPAPALIPNPIVSFFQTHHAVVCPGLRLAAPAGVRSRSQRRPPRCSATTTAATIGPAARFERRFNAVYIVCPLSVNVKESAADGRFRRE